MAEDKNNQDDQQKEIDRLRNEVDRLWSRDMAQELRLSEAKYRALIEGSSDFIYVLDKDGRFTFANAEVENLLGYTAEEIIGKHFSEVMHPEDQDELGRSFAERRTGDRATHRVEVRLHSRGGITRDVEMDIRHISLSASGIYQDESFVGTHGVARDITERKYIQTKQRALSELHRSIWSMARSDDIHQVLDGIHQTLNAIELPYAEVGIYVLDMDEPPIVQFYSTYQSENIEQKAQWMVSDAENFAGTIVQTWRRGSRVHRRSLEQEATYHAYLIELYGEIESMVDVPFSHGVLTVTTRDARLTARDLQSLSELADALSDGFRRAEDLKELTLSEQRYRRLVETPNLVVLLLDTEGNFIYVSPQIHKWLGHLPQDFYEDSNLLMRIVHGDDQETTGHFLRSYNAPPPHDIEYRWASTDGHYHWASASLFPIYEHEGDAQINRVSMVQVVIQDISERKRVEDLIKASLAEKEVLLKEIHHRVKNNLQIISSLLDLQSRGLEESYKSIFEDSQHRINSMALIHEELYNSSDLARVDFATYARSLANNLLSTYGPSSVALDVEVDALPLNLDRAIPMGLIINELVSNALKYAFPENRSGRIGISLKTLSADAFVLTVSDDGVGIKGEIDQSDPNTLGLKLVYTLAAQIKARVELDRKDGTAFSIIRDLS